MLCEKKLYDSLRVSLLLLMFIKGGFILEVKISD